MDIAAGFTELRLSLAEAQSNLRSAKDAFEVAEAQAEQRAIDAGLAGGKNIEERQRNTLLALQQDSAYLVAQKALRSAEANVDRLEALLEGARDARRIDEWRIRAQLVEALNRAGVASDSPDRASDGAFDDAADARGAERLETALRSRSEGAMLAERGQLNGRPRTVAFDGEDLPF